MSITQAGILKTIPRSAKYLTFSLKPEQSKTIVSNTINKLVEKTDGESIVVGLGMSLIQKLKSQNIIEEMREFSAQKVSFSDKDIYVPSTPIALCCWLRNDDRGELLHQTRQLKQLLNPAFTLDNVIDAFQYGPSLDLTGYEDGTENPKDKDAIDAAIVTGKGSGIDGSSFMVIQQWEHDLDYFESLPTVTQDNTFGRRISDNEEIDDAPESAHVKRTEQEAFDPEAFILRRSMPWADVSIDDSDDASDANKEGLVFVAFGHSFDAFEMLLDNMVGLNDGIPDALFSFTHPVTGSYLWCPPMKDGSLDLSALE